MKFYVSISGSDESRQYLDVVLNALFNMNEIGIGSSGLLDRLPGYQARMELLIRQADGFIAILDDTYGIVPTDQSVSIAEREYHLAIEQNKPCLIFMQAQSRETAEERQLAFIKHIEERHIVTVFTDGDDLEAKVKVSIANVHTTAPNRNALLSSIKSLMPSSQISKQEKEDEKFDADVRRGLTLVEPDLENIVRRAIELHEAQRRIDKGGDGANDGFIQVSPMWGEPESRSQFQSDIFMVMPFRDRFTEIYRDIIIPTTADLNLTMKRGDDFSSIRGSIIQEVWSALNNCRAVIAEMTEINPNVYYELGIAHTLGKPAILLTQTTEVELLPFDVRHLRFIVYSDTPEGLLKLGVDLKKALIWLLNDLKENA